MRELTATRIHIAIACLFGAAGIALLAAATHAGGARNVEIAGQMLLFHAPAILGATACRKAGLMQDTAARLALSLLLVGITLFAGDLALRGLMSARLFAMASPAGGICMILGWLGLCGAALAARRL